MFKPIRNIALFRYKYTAVHWCLNKSCLKQRVTYRVTIQDMWWTVEQW